MYSTSAECLQNVHHFLFLFCYFRGGGGGGVWHCILVSCVTSPIFVFVYFPLNKKWWQNKTHFGAWLEKGKFCHKWIFALVVCRHEWAKGQTRRFRWFLRVPFFPLSYWCTHTKKLIATSEKQSLNQWPAEWMYVWTFHSTLQAPKHLANQQQWYWSTLWTCLKHFCCTKADKIRPKRNADTCWCFPFMCTYL